MGANGPSHRPEGKVTAKHVENVVKERKAATTPQPPPRPTPNVVETPTLKPEPIDDTPKLSVVNGVPCADPPDIKKLRDSGKIAYNAIVESRYPTANRSGTGRRPDRRRGVEP